jgi:hypothetical protein
LEYWVMTRLVWNLMPLTGSLGALMVMETTGVAEVKM